MHFKQCVLAALGHRCYTCAARKYREAGTIYRYTRRPVESRRGSRVAREREREAGNVIIRGVGCLSRSFHRGMAAFALIGWRPRAVRSPEVAAKGIGLLCVYILRIASDLAAPLPFIIQLVVSRRGSMMLGSLSHRVPLLRLCLRARCSARGASRSYTTCLAAITRRAGALCAAANPLSWVVWLAHGSNG